ncbi:hypothetical protein F0562_029736 [Nyssa sinensis]|uniref:Uncharacterized protein n=1 Tax=Nyssa sinensis TaxID=561372 RepID=A0A5J5AYG2_9ASTE|nr:hypothetical protein F0562_029736 [Nyssa sinensis]
MYFMRSCYEKSLLRKDSKIPLSCITPSPSRLVKQPSTSSTQTPINSLSEKDVKAPNVFERAKEEIEAILHTEKSHHHHKETHGLRDDIDENTPIDDVKAPNVFQRAKEEIEALVQTIHPKKESKIHASNLNDGTWDLSVTEREEKSDSHPEKEVKAPNLLKRAKEEIEAIMHKEKSLQQHHHHHKETHGTSDDIDENTPINEVKGPNVFERAKEEIEALVQTIHPKKESDNVVSPPKKGVGSWGCIGRGLEKVCSPRSDKRD